MKQMTKNAIAVGSLVTVVALVLAFSAPQLINASKQQQAPVSGGEEQPIEEIPDPVEEPEEFVDYYTGDDTTEEVVAKAGYITTYRSVELAVEAFGEENVKIFGMEDAPNAIILNTKSREFLDTATKTAETNIDAPVNEVHYTYDPFAYSFTYDIYIFQQLFGTGIPTTDKYGNQVNVYTGYYKMDLTKTRTYLSLFGVGITPGTIIIIPGQDSYIPMSALKVPTIANSIGSKTTLSLTYTKYYYDDWVLAYSTTGSGPDLIPYEWFSFSNAVASGKYNFVKVIARSPSFVNEITGIGTNYYSGEVYTSITLSELQSIS